MLEWRYGEQLRWRLVLIGLTESWTQYRDRGYDPRRAARGQLAFRRYGMPFSPTPKARISGTARACRAAVAARLLVPGAEWAVFESLQMANFTSPLLLDDDEGLREVLRAMPEIDGDAIVESLDSSEVTEAYERDRAEARRAAGSPAELQGKTATSDGPVRFTAPSVIFELDGRRLVAGGFQPAEAYDVLVANLAPTITRREPPEDPEPLLAHFPRGLSTAEVAALLAQGNDAPDRVGAEAMLIDLVAAGRGVRTPIGDDALWSAPEH